MQKLQDTIQGRASGRGGLWEQGGVGWGVEAKKMDSSSTHILMEVWKKGEKRVEDLVGTSAARDIYFRRTPLVNNRRLARVKFHKGTPTLGVEVLAGRRRRASFHSDFTVPR